MHWKIKSNINISIKYTYIESMYIKKIIFFISFKSLFLTENIVYINKIIKAFQIKNKLVLIILSFI